MASAGGEFDGNDFANNLFSDLAPLLTLFGEQVTKQFLSMSMGWADNIMLAMGPLGILTVVVSAIRVGGVPKLKAIIGRAREERSTAEMELLSSTSSDVCELWTGKEIVRVRGQPRMSRPIIITADGRVQVFGDPGSSHLFTISTSSSQVSKALIDIHREWEPSVFKLLADAAPNLALNISNSAASRTEAWIWALVGCFLQLASVVFSGLATYRWNLAESANPHSTYGYPCYMVGTVLLCAGVAFCGHVVESVSSETTLSCIPDMRKKVCIVRIQRSCNVSDQHFGTFAILNSLDNPNIRYSRLEGPSKEASYFAVAGTSLAVTGFVVQFIGLRGLHWSAAVVQLGVTLMMTVIRAIVRRGLSSEVASIPLDADDECVSFAPAIDTIRHLLTLQGQEGNDKIVKARWAKFLGLYEHTRHIGEHLMVNPLDVIMTGRYFGRRTG
ncbi:hypothetical protein N658DRAFT_568772 [Parathielavia hyrcaniae]|uniref:Uncharacterized protein n=1 Tax=Parathielavia hyrcaniae TaxID=113614 RepID=A0AAN6PUW0_9PEZI|nr:hypothetical protein N658DRAFT_568772 [Parathielavia hyrcaniae]